MLSIEAPYAAQRRTALARTKADNNKDKDRFFDSSRTMITESGKALIQRLACIISEYEMDTCYRQRRRRTQAQEKFLRILDAIVCNFLLAKLLDDPRAIAVSRSNDDVARSSRYRPQPLGKQVRAVLDVMEKMGWLQQRVGYWHSKGGKQTTITIGIELADLCSGIALSDIGQLPGGETIVLTRRDDEGRRHLIDYGDTNLTVHWRENMAIINAAIAGAAIQFDPSVITKKPVDIHAKRLRRQFINGTFDNHGRMYGGFWINMSKEERRAGLTINGERVVGLDFGQTFMRLAYGRAGQPLPPVPDLYRIPGLEGYRDGVKQLINAMFNSDHMFTHYPKDTEELLPPYLTLRQVQTMIMDFHHPIRHLLCSGIGQELTIDESEIMTEVLLRLIAKGVAALPVHDCMIVGEGFRDIGTKIMMDTFLEMTGVEASISIQ